jgi:ubiquinone/menaquinone biosynthesis C-methylase UbiE
MHERRFDPAQAHRLEEPERLTFMPPEEVVAALNLSPGVVVADIGAGTGYFAVPLAIAVRPKGRLYAVDIEPAMLKRLDEKLGAPSAPDNIKLVVGDAANTTLADATCDLVLLANVWHEVEDQPAVLGEVRRILKPNGRLAILDWRTDVPARPHGVPRTDADPPGPPREHRIPDSAVNETLRAHGWTDVKSIYVGLYSYLVTATCG